MISMDYNPVVPNDDCTNGGGGRTKKQQLGLGRCGNFKQRVMQVQIIYLLPTMMKNDK